MKRLIDITQKDIMNGIQGDCNRCAVALALRREYKTDDNLNVSIIVDSFEGKKLNSPNDICVKSDGTIWFTDPPYGILSDYEGYLGDQEYGGCFVFRLISFSLTASIPNP